MKLRPVLGLALVALAVAGLFAYLQSEYTQCFAVFDSRPAAESAASSARDAGFDAEMRSTHARVLVTVSDGETGEDARSFRTAFGQLVDREGGTLVHSGDGCLERTAGD